MRISAVTDDVSTKLGLEGAGFKVDSLDPVTEIDPVVVRAEIDYSEFSVDHSMDWVYRLQALRTPDCLAESPASPTCTASVPLAIDNDVAHQVLVAEFVLDPTDPGLERFARCRSTTRTRRSRCRLASRRSRTRMRRRRFRGSRSRWTRRRRPIRTRSSSTPRVRGPVSGGALGTAKAYRAWKASGSGGSTYGLTAGYSSSFGSYTATPLSNAGSWSAGLQSGSFDWSYSVPTVPVGFGSAPAVSLGSSSGAVDGVTSDSNTQPGTLGHGWDLSAGGYIERQERFLDDVLRCVLVVDEQACQTDE